MLHNSCEFGKNSIILYNIAKEILTFVGKKSSPNIYIQYFHSIYWFIYLKVQSKLWYNFWQINGVYINMPNKQSNSDLTQAVAVLSTVGEFFNRTIWLQKVASFVFLKCLTFERKLATESDRLPFKVWTLFWRRRYYLSRYFYSNRLK